MSCCKSCGAEIDWLRTAEGKYIPVDPEPVLVIEGEGNERFYSEEEGVLTGRQAEIEEESPELPVAFVRHRCGGNNRKFKQKGTSE